MVTWVEQVHKRASAFQNQIAAARMSEVSSGVSLSGVIELFQYKLEELYLEEMPLAHIRDTSDLVFHAEGPSTATNNPGLHAFNWLCTSAEKHSVVLSNNRRLDPITKVGVDHVVARRNDLRDRAASRCG